MLCLFISSEIRTSRGTVFFHSWQVRRVQKSCTFALETTTKMKLRGRNTLLMLVGMLILQGIVACRDHSPKNDDASLRYRLALAMLEKDSVKAAEDMLRASIRLARETNDLHTLYLSQSRLAQLLADGSTAAAVDMMRQALQTYERQPDSERNHIILLDYLGTYLGQLAYEEETSFDEALDYLQRAHALAEASRDTMGSELVSQTLTSLANIHWAMEDFDEALRCAREGEACAPASLKLGAQHVLARCLVSADSLVEAEALYRAMQPGDDVKLAYIIQTNLTKLALKRHDAAEAEEAIDSAFAQAEELYFDAMRQKDDYYQATMQQERSNERMRYASALYRRTMWGVVAFAAVLLIAGFLVARDRLRVVATRRKAEVWQRKHEVDNHIHEAIRRRQDEQMLRQNMEAQHTLLRQREGTISFLQDFVLQRSEAIRKLKGIAERPILFSPHEWQEVERTLDAIDEDRFARIRQRYPELRDEDIQVCILTRLRLPNRAIGNLFSITVSAAQHRKLKIKKEIFGEPNPDITLEQVLARL